MKKCQRARVGTHDARVCLHPRLYPKSQKTLSSVDPAPLWAMVRQLAVDRQPGLAHAQLF